MILGLRCQELGLGPPFRRLVIRRLEARDDGAFGHEITFFVLQRGQAAWHLGRNRCLGSRDHVAVGREAATPARATAANRGHGGTNLDCGGPERPDGGRRQDDQEGDGTGDDEPALARFGWRGIGVVAKDAQAGKLGRIYHVTNRDGAQPLRRPREAQRAEDGCKGGSRLYLNHHQRNENRP